MQRPLGVFGDPPTAVPTEARPGCPHSLPHNEQLLLGNPSDSQLLLFWPEHRWPSLYLGPEQKADSLRPQMQGRVSGWVRRAWVGEGARHGS